MKHRAKKKTAKRAANKTANTTAAPKKTPVESKPAKVPVDWAAAGRKAWATRLRNAAAGAPANVKSANPHPASAASIGSPAADGPATV